MRFFVELFGVRVDIGKARVEEKLVERVGCRYLELGTDEHRHASMEAEEARARVAKQQADKILEARAQVALAEAERSKELHNVVKLALDLKEARDELGEARARIRELSPRAN